MNLLVKILITALVTLLCLLLLAYSIIGVILLGPSKDASRMLLEALSESNSTKFIPSLYMSKEKANDILNSHDNGEIIITETVVITLSDN